MAPLSARSSSPHSGSLSPPTYSVESDGKGNLKCSKYRIQWPKRPKLGKHSIEEELEMRVGKLKTTGAAEGVDDDRDVIKKMELRVCANEKPTTYEIRALRMDRANHKFEQYKKRNFMIYYRRPECIERDINSIPLAIPLTIACKDAANKILHYQVKCYTCKDENGKVEQLWCAVRTKTAGEEDGEEKEKVPYRLGFSNARTLLEYWSTMNACCNITAAKMG